MDNRRSSSLPAPRWAFAVAAACLLLSLLLALLSCRLYRKHPADGILAYLCRDDDLAVVLSPREG